MLNLPSNVLQCIGARLYVRYLEYIINEQDEDTLAVPHSRIAKFYLTMVLMKAALLPSPRWL